MTAEELRVRRTLDLIGNNPSFDILKFLERLSGGPDWSQLIVAHIYLDHIITETLKDQLPAADAYLQGHKSFVDKLSLCQALGYFQDDIGPVLKAINSARNKFAHKLVFNVTNEEKINLFRLFTKTRTITDILKPEGLENFLVTVVLFAEVERAVQRKLSDLSEKKAIIVGELFDTLRQLRDEADGTEHDQSEKGA